MRVCGDQALSETTETDEVTEIFRRERRKGKGTVTIERGNGETTPATATPLTATAIATTTPTPTKLGAHSSYWVFSILGPESQGGQAFKRVAPGLRQPKKNEGMILLALVVMAGVIGSFGGVALYGYTHPPLQLVGVCTPPAILDGGSCYTIQIAVVNQQTTTVHVGAGYLIFPNNGTRYNGP